VEKTNPHSTLSETNHIPVQILFNVIMYLVEDLVDVVSFWPWNNLSKRPRFMATRRGNSSSQEDSCWSSFYTPWLEHIKASRNKTMRIHGEVRHGGSIVGRWRRDRGKIYFAS
jgi:hypothetical protein